MQAQIKLLPRPEPILHTHNEDVIATLEEMLQAVKAGQVENLAFCYSAQESLPSMTYSASSGFLALSAALMTQAALKGIE